MIESNSKQGLSLLRSGLFGSGSLLGYKKEKNQLLISLKALDKLTSRSFGLLRSRSLLFSSLFGSSALSRSLLRRSSGLGLGSSRLNSGSLLSGRNSLLGSGLGGSLLLSGFSGSSLLNGGLLLSGLGLGGLQDCF